jgi:cardiolipin synthase
MPGGFPLYANGAGRRHHGAVSADTAAAPAATYRAGDLVRVPGLLSLCRLPLAVAFPFTTGRVWWAIAVLAAAGVSDVLDGWYARRFKQQTLMGAVLDAVMDKVFVLTVLVTLVLTHGLSVVQVLVMSAREIGQLPLLVRSWFRPRDVPRGARAANLLGKLATVAQFVAVVAVLLGAPRLELFVYATGALGAAAAIVYWRREVAPAGAA